MIFAEYSFLATIANWTIDFQLQMTFASHKKSAKCPSAPIIQIFDKTNVSKLKVLLIHLLQYTYYRDYIKLQVHYVFEHANRIEQAIFFPEDLQTQIFEHISSKIETCSNCKVNDGGKEHRQRQ